MKDLFDKTWLGSDELSFPSNAWNRPVLYTDTTNGGKQACRDDLWAVTTNELNALWNIAFAVRNTTRGGLPHDFPSLLKTLRDATENDRLKPWPNETKRTSL